MPKNSGAAEATGEPRARRPRGSLTREAVVQAALEVVDAEGVEALSMPRLARELDAGVMTLYRYVQSKQELLDAVAQRAIGQVRIEAPPGSGPEGILAGWARGMRRMFLDHPGVAEVMAPRAVIGPGIFRGINGLMGMLQGGGYGGVVALRAIYTALIYTLGFSIWEAARVHGQPEGSYAALWRAGFAQLAPGEVPHVETVLAELGTLASDAQFEFGLAALIRGISAQALPPDQASG
jgi:AcrR family transcriptional regulator